MTCRIIYSHYEKVLGMFPLSVVLFTLACLTPSMISAFSRLSTRSSSKSGTNISNQCMTTLWMGQSHSSSNTDQTDDAGLKAKEVVVFGSAALEKLVTNANYAIPPMSQKIQFLQWAKETTKRKLNSDKEFKERVKVRELKKLHSMDIQRLEDALKTSKALYHENPNSLLINDLDRAISNCQQAAANMEKFLFTSPSSTAEGSEINTELNQNESVDTANDIKVIVNLIYDPSSFSDDFAVNLPGPTTIADTNIIAASLPVDNNAFSPGDVLEKKSVIVDKLSARRRHVSEIYPAKKQELFKNEQERNILLKETPEYFTYMKCHQDLMDLFEEIGLNAAEKNVLTVQKGAGKGRNSRGRSFEDTADSVLTDHLLPRLAEAHNCLIEDLIIVRNLKLGMASNKGATAELDSVVCIRTDRPARMNMLKPRGSFCKVLAVVEVKRNPDDVGNAFLGYQRSLAWLSGRQDLYDPLDWQTKAYPKGHFNERPFLHDLNGETIVFSTESFESLRLKSVEMNLPIELCDFEEGKGRSVGVMVDGGCSNDSDDQSNYASASTQDILLKNEIDSSDGDITPHSSMKQCSLFVEDLYFVTKNGALDSIHSKAMCWVLNKISCETDFDTELSDEDAVEKLRLRVEARYPHSMSTYDLISMYSAHLLAGQLFVVNEDKFPQ